MPEFSVKIMPTVSAGEIAEIASFAEDMGCSRCWIYDEGLVTRDVYVVLAAIAMKTQKMKFERKETRPKSTPRVHSSRSIISVNDLIFHRMKMTILLMQLLKKMKILTQNMTKRKSKIAINPIMTTLIWPINRFLLHQKII